MPGVAFLDIMAQRTLADVKRQMIALCQANSLPVSSWVTGDPSERWVDITPRLVFAVLASITTQAVRGMFLALATDPGDAGDLSADQTPRAGFLSALGEGWYGTTRRGETRSTTTVTIENTGSGTTGTIPTFGLTFTTAPPGDGPSGGGEAAKSNGGRPTFRNTEGSIALAPGASVTLDVQCEQSGTYGSVSANSLVLVTHSFDGAGLLEVTASALAVGQGRESADSYRARCKLAASKLSPGGPQAAYKYAATTARDGTPLQRHDGTGAVGITWTYVSASSSTGSVVAKFADDDGAADAVDVASANANIEGIALGDITDPLGVVPDAVTYVGSAAGETSVTIVGTANIKRVSGVSDSDLKSAAEDAIDEALAAFFASSATRDRVATAGALLTVDLIGAIYGAYAGLTGVALSSPAGSSTSVTAGNVAKLAGSTPYVTVTVTA